MNFSFLTVIVLFAILPQTCTQIWANIPKSVKELEVKPREILPEKKDLVIELAIFLDAEFTNIFEISQVNLLQYWEAVLYDVHIRFASLSSFKVSFRVTTLETITSLSDQSFLGIGIYKNNNFSVLEIADKLELWTFSKLKQTPQFDIAVLVLPSSLPYHDGHNVYRRKASICHGKDQSAKRWITNIVLAMQVHPSLALAQSIADILGAPDDDDPKYWHICNPSINASAHCCIMNHTKSILDLPPHFFSHCTDRFLSEALPQNIPAETNCMDRQSSYNKAIIDTDDLFQSPSKVHAYTYKQQCQLLLRDFNVVVNKEACFMVQCSSNLYPQSFAFTPLAGSSCGNNGKWRCLRSACIQPEVQLMNVGTGKCLVPEYSQFSPNDKAVLRDCSKVSMDLFLGTNVLKQGNLEVTSITMMYSAVEGSGYKHLKPIKNLNFSFEARFEPHEQLDGQANWIIRRLREERKPEKFLLLHKGICAVAAKDGKNIEFWDNCSSTDLNAVWAFKKILGTESYFSTIVSRNFVNGYFPTDNNDWVNYVILVIVALFMWYLICLFRTVRRSRDKNRKRTSRDLIMHRNRTKGGKFKHN